MNVIPFDPGLARPGGHAAGPAPGGRDAATPAPRLPPGGQGDLEQALYQNRALERLLIAALRQNAVNWARAEYTRMLLSPER